MYQTLTHESVKIILHNNIAFVIHGSSSKYRFYPRGGNWTDRFCCLCPACIGGALRDVEAALEKARDLGAIKAVLRTAAETPEEISNLPLEDVENYVGDYGEFSIVTKGR